MTYRQRHYEPEWLDFRTEPYEDEGRLRWGVVDQFGQVHAADLSRDDAVQRAGRLAGEQFRRMKRAEGLR